MDGILMEVLPPDTSSSSNSSSISSNRNNTSFESAAYRSDSEIDEPQSRQQQLDFHGPVLVAYVDVSDSSSNAGTNDSNLHRYCKFCLSGDNRIGEWLAPCMCRGSIKYVHSTCFERWISVASGTMKFACPICRYVYRRRWAIKPCKLWHWPRLGLRMGDIIEIYIDICLTYRLFRDLPRCLDNRVTFFIYSGCALLWKIFVATRTRLNFYANIAHNLALSICTAKILDAA